MQFRDVPVDGWEKIVHVEDQDTGMNAIIAVHDATLGPGCGGLRMFPYTSFDAALEDVKNLSRGMSYKNALGGIPFGGGKSVIIADPKTDKTDDIFRTFGRALNELNGAYYTAQDSGVSDHDLAVVHSVTKYVGGIKTDDIGGNPGPFTARGVWQGVKAAARQRLGADNLNGLHVCILGVGSVGMALADLLHEEGAILTVADVNEAATAHAAKHFGATVVTPEEAFAQEVDIFSPCALGGAINEMTLDQLKAKVIAGAANNQLKTPDMDAALKERDILYAPDFVINAAGVISVGLEILGEWTLDGLNARIDTIGVTLTQLFERAACENRPTGEVADEMALEVIERGRRAA